jgi:two-component system response regulator AtoC
VRLGIGLDTPCPQGDDSVEALNLGLVVREAETRAIQRAHKAASGSMQRTAELLGISPRTLRHKLAQFGLKL